MAKNDYFVLVYKLLKYLYECLKSGEKPEAEAISPNALGINPHYWLYLMKHLEAEAFLSGIQVNLCTVRLWDVQITPKGIEYLLGNGMMQKAAASLRPSTVFGV